MVQHPDPKLFQHIVSLYKVLSATAVDGVWEGSQREAFDALGLSQSYNATLYRALRELGCVEVLFRGHGPQKSRLRLISEPQIESFIVWNRNQKPLTSRTTLRNIEERLAAVERLLPQGVSLPNWIVSVEERLSAVEKERDGKTKKDGRQ
jgi:hypothetical protein